LAQRAASSKMLWRTRFSGKLDGASAGKTLRKMPDG